MGRHSPSGSSSRAEFVLPSFISSCPCPRARQPQSTSLTPPYLLLVSGSFSVKLCYFYARCNGSHTFQKSFLTNVRGDEMRLCFLVSSVSFDFSVVPERPENEYIFHSQVGAAFSP